MANSVIYKANINKVKVNANTLEDVIGTIRYGITEEVEKNIKIDQQFLRIKAAEFIGNIKYLNNVSKNAKMTQLKNAIYNKEPDKGRVYSEYIDKTNKSKNQVILQAKYLLANNFEKYLDSFRGKQKDRKIIFVHEDKENKVLRSYSIRFEDLVLMSQASGQINTQGLLKLLKNQIQAATIEENVKDEIEKAKLDAATDAYFEVKQRLLNFHNKYGKKNGIPEGTGLLMQQIGKIQHIARVLNAGDQKEAYISFLKTEKNPMQNTIKYRNTNTQTMHYFIRYYFYNYISKVGNLAAIIEEDVVDNFYEYGIKGDDAKLPSLTQYIKVASQIMQQENNLSREELEAALRNEPKLSTDAKRNIEYDISNASTNILIKKLLKENQGKQNQT